MGYLILCYLFMAVVNFVTSIKNQHIWADMRGKSKMQRFISWVVITVLNPIFALVYFSLWAYCKKKGEI